MADPIERNRKWVNNPNVVFILAGSKFNYKKLLEVETISWTFAINCWKPMLESILNEK